MDGMAFVFNNQQSIEELQHSLLCTSLELKSVQLAVREEKRRNEENVKQLLHLLHTAFRERDEAKGNLQRLLNEMMQSGIPQLCDSPPDPNPDSPPFQPTRGHSSITESASLSDTFNQSSYASSPVDSFLVAVSSPPDLSKTSMDNSMNTRVVTEPRVHGVSPTLAISSESSFLDPSSALIDQLAMEKKLPEKGKLLESVMEAGPLLQTLLVAGPLPQWRNPPPMKPVQIPPISIKGSKSGDFGQEFFAGVCVSTVPSLPFAASPGNSEGKNQACPASVQNFSGSAPGSSSSPASNKKQRKAL